MPQNKENHLEHQVKAAEEKLLGKKFCFACQRSKPIDTGKYFIRRTSKGINKVWKCAQCAAKLTEAGFKNAA